MHKLTRIQKITRFIVNATLYLTIGSFYGWFGAEILIKLFM